MQVLYAAGSLGRLGADFTMMISTLFEEDEQAAAEGEPESQDHAGETDSEEDHTPEWARAIQKHRVQSARLNALSGEVAVK